LLDEFRSRYTARHMARETFLDLLPAVYRELCPPFFAREAIVEEKATCSDCAMCDKNAGVAAGPTFFRPDTKCCTYQPKLPNFLVGAVLRDGNPAMAEGGRRIRARIEQRIGVTPQWLAPGRKYSVLLEASRLTSFGRSTTLRCSFYEVEGGLCTIWKHREAACSTFFCKHLGGQDGKAFWVALETWLSNVERRLSAHALSVIAPELEEPVVPHLTLTMDDLEDRPPERYAQIWGAWHGREAELYARCHEVISALDRNAFVRIVDDADLLAELERRYAAATAPALAERLVLNPEISIQPIEGGVMVSTYSRYEPMMLSEPLYAVLQQFSAAERTDEVLARLKREHEVELPDGLLVSLQQMGVVVPAGG
jgi:Fe-S-cluster containining protein